MQRALVIAALSACASPPAMADAGDLLLYAGRPHPTLRVHVAGFADHDQPLAGDSVSIGPVNPDVADSRVTLRRSDKSTRHDALTMRWKDAWSANLRFVASKPLDLRPYVPDGTIEFDLNAVDMAKAGLSFAMGCGPDCGRTINYVVPSRALQGRGWQHVALPLRCFERDGNDFSAVTQPFVVDSSGSGEVAIANVRIVRHGRPNVECVDYRLESVTPRPQEEVWSLDWWMPRHEEKLKQVRELVASGRRPQVVFVGDSITQGWENEGRRAWEQHFAKYDAVALGFSGDRTENVLWRLQHGELDGMKPKAVVLMIGTNNTGHRQEDPRAIAAGIKRLIEEIGTRQPQAKVLLLAIFPRDELPSSRLRRINDRVNGLISGYADNQRVFFLNINEIFTARDGTLSRDLMPDLLHLSEKGYGMWATAIAPVLQRLLSP
ncbi:MAG TPA: GDSL-type esterase/lipase family protein [Albitalea sp.]|nr:GDSL-type esterase/lipase family protein [Albitalea sp.]